MANPRTNASGKIVYSIAGYDRVGRFSGLEKRYSDFFELHEWLTQRYQGLFVPEIPPKKAIGNKTFDFIEERRQMLQEFLLSLSRHEFLWRSEEFTAWVRTSAAQDLVAILKENIKLKIKSMPSQDGDLADRIERYDAILTRIKHTADFDNQQLDTIQLLQLVEQTNRFALSTIPWLKNMATVFKQLAEKNTRFLASQKGLQLDVEEYRSSVCVKNGSKNKAHDQSGIFLLPADLNQDT